MDCDPVAQTGCGPEEKCSQVVLVANPFQSETRCVPDGTAQRGEQCSFGPSGDQGFDDCEGGLYCNSEQCMEICSMSPDSCGSTEACAGFAALFEDREGVGLCEFACDPLLQDCPEMEDACYLIFGSTNARTACGRPFLDPGPGQQGDPCSSINTCAKGYGCGLQDDPINSTGLVCAFFCDSTGSGGPSCADGPGASLTCAEIRTFYSDVDAPAGLGICIDCTVWTEAAECQ